MRISPQNYPRIQDETSRYRGFLDEAQLVTHPAEKISTEEIKNIVKQAIQYAEQKSGREIINIPQDASPSDIQRIYKKEGAELFKYFKKYVTDPAAVAHTLFGRNYKDVGIEYFRLRTVQKQRMNSGWRYQYLALNCAQNSRRFTHVSDLGTQGADFNAVINQIDLSQPCISLYISVKNRANTMGGQDWPKAIQALEGVASTDRNRTGPYLCVFGLVMDRSSYQRLIKVNSRTKSPYSSNTEIWYANFFWPFFANYAYEEIMKIVLIVLQEITGADTFSTEVSVPPEVIDSFGNICKIAHLINDRGVFDDANKLVEMFCGS